MDMRNCGKISAVIVVFATIILSCKKHSGISLTNPPLSYTVNMGGTRNWHGTYTGVPFSYLTTDVHCAFAIKVINDSTILINDSDLLGYWNNDTLTHHSSQYDSTYKITFYTMDTIWGGPPYVIHGTFVFYNYANNSMVYSSYDPQINGPGTSEILYTP